MNDEALSLQGPNKLRRRQLLSDPAEVGRWCIAVATFGLAVARLILGDGMLPDASAGRSVAQIGLLLAAGTAIAATAIPHRSAFWLGPGLFWTAMLVLAIGEGAPDISLIALVEPLEAVFVVSAIAATTLGDRLRNLNGVAVAAGAGMLLLFGSIHLLHATAVSGLVPSWTPLRHAIPYLTGSVQIAGGLLLACGRMRPVAATAVALMFLSWLPLVHLQRLLAEPDSLDEWRFALTALALAGSLLIVGKGAVRGPSEKGAR